jgi:DNA-binding response OmpR family regulator
MPFASETGLPLPNTPVIVAVARDPALLRSLVFALEAHGHRVTAFASWRTARESAGRASLVILDERLPSADKEAGLALLSQGVPVVLLAENDAVRAEMPGLRVLPKPLSGPDVVETVAALRRSA